MGAESRLRQRHRDAIRMEYPHALIVGQPANGLTGPGRHDFYVVVAGRYIGLELKTGKGRATLIQKDRIRRTREAGGWADVVRSPDQSLALIRHALAGGPVWDNLFSDAPEEKSPEPDEVRAFQTKPEAVQSAPKGGEGVIRDHVERNGLAPSGDGVFQSPPDDYPYAVIINELQNIRRMQGALETLLMHFMNEAGINPPNAGAQVPAEEPTPKPPRRSRKAQS